MIFALAYCSDIEDYLDFCCYTKAERGDEDTFTFVYGPQFPSTNFGLCPTSVNILPSRYSFIACACAGTNELKITVWNISNILTNSNFKISILVEWWAMRTTKLLRPKTDWQQALYSFWIIWTRQCHLSYLKNK